MIRKVVLVNFPFTEALALTDTRHRYWKQELAHDREYYEKAYERLDYLALWFFEGQDYRKS